MPRNYADTDWWGSGAQFQPTSAWGNGVQITAPSAWGDGLAQQPAQAWGNTPQQPQTTPQTQQQWTPPDYSMQPTHAYQVQAQGPVQTQQNTAGQLPENIWDKNELWGGIKGLDYSKYSNVFAQNESDAYNRLEENTRLAGVLRDYVNQGQMVWDPITRTYANISKDPVRLPNNQLSYEKEIIANGGNNPWWSTFEIAPGTGIDPGWGADLIGSSSRYTPPQTQTQAPAQTGGKPVINSEDFAELLTIAQQQMGLTHEQARDLIFQHYTYGGMAPVGGHSYSSMEEMIAALTGKTGPLFGGTTDLGGAGGRRSIGSGDYAQLLNLAVGSMGKTQEEAKALMDQYYTMGGMDPTGGRTYTSENQMALDMIDRLGPLFGGQYKPKMVADLRAPSPGKVMTPSNVYKEYERLADLRGRQEAERGWETRYRQQLEPWMNPAYVEGEQVAGWDAVVPPAGKSEVEKTMKDFLEDPGYDQYGVKRYGGVVNAVRDLYAKGLLG